MQVVRYVVDLEKKMLDATRQAVGRKARKKYTEERCYTAIQRAVGKGLLRYGARTVEGSQILHATDAGYAAVGVDNSPWRAVGLGTASAQT